MGIGAEQFFNEAKNRAFKDTFEFCKDINDLFNEKEFIALVLQHRQESERSHKIFSSEREAMLHGYACFCARSHQIELPIAVKNVLRRCMFTMGITKTLVNTNKKKRSKNLKRRESNKNIGLGDLIEAERKRF